MSPAHHYQKEVRTQSEDVLENLILEVSKMKGQIEGYKKLGFRHKFSRSFLESMDEILSGVRGVLIPGLVVLGGLPNPVLNVERQEA